MEVNAVSSGKAPPGRSKFGASTMAPAFPVAACGSHADDSAGPAAAVPHSATAGERFLDLRMAEAYTSALPEGGAAAVREQDAKTPGLGRPFFGGTGVAGAEVEGGTRRGWIPGAW